MPFLKADTNFLDPEILQFAILSDKDTKRLSVVKVISSLTFDGLDFPYPGGLYDSAMGPYHFNSDPCGTCHKMFDICTGHIGHIDLNMPVFNPFFMATVHKLLRISCLECNRIQLSDFQKDIISLQLNLIDRGFIVEAKDLELYKSSNATVNHQEAIENNEDMLIENYKSLIRNMKKVIEPTSSMEQLKAAIIKAALNCETKRCIHCKEPMKRVRMSYGKLVFNFSKGQMVDFYQNFDIDEQTMADKVKQNNKIILASECSEYFRKIFEKEENFLRITFPILEIKIDEDHCHPTDMFFMSIIPVIPPLVRPCNKMNNHIIEHPQTLIYKDIIVTNASMNAVITYMKAKEEGRLTSNVSDEAKIVFQNANGDSAHEKIYNLWGELQQNINKLLDSAGEKNQKGLKQIIEKKQGIIRMNMMGKRVDYACRTVITPDPNINVDEIGIPEIFAKKLSFPCPTTFWNVNELRKLVINGPNQFPGANFIEMGNGKKVLIPPHNSVKREGLAKLLTTPVDDSVKVVHRHLKNGDYLLLNRQPTLHRPSIQGHKARILKGEKTIRMHYSNCKAYNADFDGDEMNAHFPQNLIGQSEAGNLVNVANNYLVPKDGTPLGGLIQDYVISGVALTMRGKFLNRTDYQQLVFQGLSNIEGNIELLPPTILKPVKLWSGKQVLSTIFINLMPKDKSKRLNLKSVANIPSAAWITQPKKTTTWYGGTELQNEEMSESEVIIRQGELLVGVLDKKHYGSTPYGLIHSIYELYGPECSTRLLSSLSKCFTAFLQWQGFTLGVHDILVESVFDKERHKIVKKSRKCGNKITTKTLNLPNHNILPEEMTQELETAFANDPKFRLILDRSYKSALNIFTNKINSACLPKGLVSRFPNNNLQLMVQSGAKGSTVNAMQISCLLGQIELEGKRPPLMISGKSLPSFTIFETSPMSGGFIDSRFMTGIKPQEFFFHCMAGREGLIDTAVKTSRSGYLQRCLIKHLEGITVHYDMTVRDSDKSVLQFMYGDDGMDIGRSQFLKPQFLEFLASNKNVIVNDELLELVKNEPAKQKELSRHLKKIRSWCKSNGLWSKKRISGFQKFSMDVKDEIDIENPNKMNEQGRREIDSHIIKLWTEADEEKKNLYSDKFSRCLDPVISKFKPDNVFGSISENLEGLIASYRGSSASSKELKKLIHAKAFSSFAPPGESVGLLAAQSIGEPSTQMTLNTFHFAGRGEMNVTLGIPRLREILMLATEKIKTPSMDIPFKKVENVEKIAEKLRQKMTYVTVADVLESINVKSSLKLMPTRRKHYTLRFNFLPQAAQQGRFSVRHKTVIFHIAKEFSKMIFRTIVRVLSAKNSAVDIEMDKSEGKGAKNDYNYDDEFDASEITTKSTKKSSRDDSSESEEENDTEADASHSRLKKRRTDGDDYDSDDSEVGGKQDETIDEETKIEEELEIDDDFQNDISELVKENDEVQKFRYDKKNFLWCELQIELLMKYRDVDISSILREVASKSVIWEVPKIKRAITYTNDKQELVLKTEGINIHEMFKYNDILDLNKLYSNDMHAIAKTYGIEAARKIIVSEVQNVFNVYGIQVNPRHLMLIADYMTCDGTIKSFNRAGMKFCPSILQKMTFESSLLVLKDAIENGRKDYLQSPSSRLILGLPMSCGTGAFSLLTDYNLFLNK